MLSVLHGLLFVFITVTWQKNVFFSFIYHLETFWTLFLFSFCLSFSFLQCTVHSSVYCVYCVYFPLFHLTTCNIMLLLVNDKLLNMCKIRAKNLSYFASTVSQIYKTQKNPKQKKCSPMFGGLRNVEQKVKHSALGCLASKILALSFNSIAVFQQKVSRVQNFRNISDKILQVNLSQTDGWNQASNNCMFSYLSFKNISRVNLSRNSRA